jgi:hypothetical protein
MLNNLRTKLPALEDVGNVAVDRVVKAANTAAQSAKDATGQVEEWTKDGLDSMKSRPLMWGAASLGFGALMGGLFALWRKTKPAGRVARRTVSARSRVKQSLRAAAGSAVDAVKPKKQAKRTKHARPSVDA